MRLVTLCVMLTPGVTAPWTFTPSNPSWHHVQGKLCLNSLQGGTAFRQSRKLDDLPLLLMSCGT
jgi:hypothetical protein